MTILGTGVLLGAATVAQAGGMQVVSLNSQTQGGGCYSFVRPTNTAGLRAPMTLSARLGIDPESPLDPLAPGLAGAVSFGSAAGVRSFSCQGTGGVSGNDPLRNEELIFGFDQPVLAKSVSLRTLNLDFTVDEPVLFLSDSTGAGFEYVITKQQLQAAYKNTGSSTGLIELNKLSLDDGIRIDRFAFRETSDDFSVGQVAFLAPPSADLDQVRNGATGSPTDPGAWVNGNAGSSNSHYIESFSIPYRVRMTDLPTGTPITLTLGYDIKHSDKHAIDYLTHYDRLEPHVGVFGHSAETIDPLIGVSGVSPTVTTFAIPAPSSAGSPVAGQPTTSFNLLFPAERVFTLFGGTITNVAYVTEGNLAASSAETRIDVTFTVDSSTAVLAWGGHIASRVDWGFDGGGGPRSAGGVSGSPYHMRLIDWNLNNLGNQDRSLSAEAVIDPCEDVVCPGATECDAGQECDQYTGVCEDLPDPPAGTSCDADGNLCTLDECDGSGSCLNVGSVSCPGPSGACDAGTQCNPATGACDALPDPALSTPCEADGDLCTNDHCDGGGNCVFLSDVTCSGPANSCDGGQACSSGVCVDLPDAAVGTTCELDGNLCTVDRCNGTGQCVQQSVTSCSHLDDACNNAACNPGTGVCDVTPEPLSAPCTADGSLCTIDHCNGSGLCVTFDTVSCPDGSGPCDAGQACNPSNGLCENLPDPPLSTPCEADGNLCTDDHCNGSGMCVFLANVSCPGATGFCDGGQSCEPSTGACVDNPDQPAGTSCQADGNLCTLDECDGAGNCVQDSTTDCSSFEDQCNDAVCNTMTGVCDLVPKPPSTPCEADGDLCTLDHCDGSGACVNFDDVSCSGPTGECDAGKACNPSNGMCEDLLDPPVSTPCEADGNLCTQDHCNGSGACVTFDNVTCANSSNPCDAGEQCNPDTGLCEFLPDPPLSMPCEADGNLCTIDHCNGAGACVTFDNVDCPGGMNSCDAGTACEPSTGACVDLPDPPLSTPCEADGNLCTIDHCNGGGACVSFDMVDCPGPIATCDGGQVCQPSTGTCVNAPEPPLSTPCEADGDLCTIDHCDGAGTCVNLDMVTCLGPSEPCDGGQVCQPATGACVDATDPSLSTPCEADGDLCTIDHCNGSGSCVTFDMVSCPGPTSVCDGGQSCQSATGTCADNPDPLLSTPCEADGDLCTIDHCDGSGMCVSFDDVACPGPSGACDAGQSCNPATGMCLNNPDPPLSTPCEADGNLCTIDHCDGLGACVFLDDASCPAPTGFCDAGQACNPSDGACQDLPDPLLSTPCEADGDLCTIDHCNGTGSCVLLGTVQCQPAVPPCEAGTTCNPSTGGCEPLADAPLSTPCEADGNLCTNDHCDGAGSCVFLDSVVCAPAAPPCEAGEMCQPATGACVPLMDASLSTPCEADGNLCTNDHCDGAGSCVFLSDVVCSDPIPPCDGGSLCNPSTGLCEDQPDAPLSAPCEADMDTCTLDHCDGQGSCAVEELLCGGCCDGDTGGCIDEQFAEQCVGEQATFFQGQECQAVIDSGECFRHRGACCDTSPGLGGLCTDEVFPEDCDPTGTDPQRTWYKGLTCAETGPCEEARGACCDGNTGGCVDDALIDDCASDQSTFFKGQLCADVVQGGQCFRHRGACCNTSPGSGGLCTDDVFPEDCDPTGTDPQRTWYKGQNCDEIGPCEEFVGACCDALFGDCDPDVLLADCICEQCSWTKGATCEQVLCTGLLGACCDTGTNDPTVAVCMTTTLAECNCEKCTWTQGATCEDIVCDPNFVPIPTVSEWGLVILALLLLTGGKIYFGRREELLA